MDASKTADGRGEGARASLVALALTMSLRQADAVLLPAVYLEVQERFGVSATQLGLASFYAGVSQALISPAAAALAERWRRPGVIAFGCALWGVATILVGLVCLWTFVKAFGWVFRGKSQRKALGLPLTKAV